MNFGQILKRASNRSSRTIFSFCFFVLTSACGSGMLNGEQLLPHEDATVLGNRLETQFWNAVQAQDIRLFSHKLAHVFQGLNVNGIYTRAEQIAAFTGINVKNFQINNGIGRRVGNDLVFTYDFDAVSADLTDGPNVSVWRFFPRAEVDQGGNDHHSSCSSSGNRKHKNKKPNQGSWKIISHSYVPFLSVSPI